jgi:hypothetical protein
MVAQYFAQLDENNIVTDIRVVSKQFLEANPQRYTGRWIETFVDDPNKQYAGVGFTYDEIRDEFVAPQPYASWTLDENNDWNPPKPMPSTGGPYRWSEEDLEWVVI